MKRDKSVTTTVDLPRLEPTTLIDISPKEVGMIMLHNLNDAQDLDRALIEARAAIRKDKKAVRYVVLRISGATA